MTNRADFLQNCNQSRTIFQIVLRQKIPAAHYHSSHPNTLFGLAEYYCHPIDLSLLLCEKKSQKPAGRTAPQCGALLPHWGAALPDSLSSFEKWREIT